MVEQVDANDQLRIVSLIEKTVLIFFELIFNRNYLPFSQFSVYNIEPE